MDSKDYSRYDRYLNSRLRAPPGCLRRGGTEEAACGLLAGYGYGMGAGPCEAEDHLDGFYMNDTGLLSLADFAAITRESW